MVFYDGRNAAVTSAGCGACKRSQLRSAAMGSLGVTEKAAQNILRAFVIASVLTERVGHVCATVLVHISEF